MADPFLLIDGYNLMHAAGMFRRRYGPGEFEKWRDRFLAHIARRLTERERQRTTIVFDTPEDHRRAAVTISFEEMRVIYADSEDEADDVLEELIARHSAPRQILLISSDHRLQKAAKRRRGRFLDSEDFVARLEQRGDMTGPEDDSWATDPKQVGLSSPEEVDAWLRVFGETSDNQSPLQNPPAKQRPNHSAEHDIDIAAWQRDIDNMQ